MAHREDPGPGALSTGGTIGWGHDRLGHDRLGARSTGGTIHWGTIHIATDASAASGWGEGPTLWTAVAGVNIAVGAAIIALHRRRQSDMPDPLHP